MTRIAALFLAAATLAACSARDGSASFAPSGVAMTHSSAMRLTGRYFVPSFGCVNIDGMVKGPDKRVWFTEFSGDAIGAITTHGTVSVYPTGSNSQPLGIGVRRKTIWAGGYGGTMLRSTKTGALTSYPIAAAHIGDVLEGPDKNVWFTDYGNNKIGRITKTGAIAEFALPGTDSPDAMAVGPDKNFWVTAGHEIVKIDVSGTAIKSYGKNLTKGEFINAIVNAPDGRLYFSEAADDNKTPDKIGRITTSGKISEIGSLPVGAYPNRLIVGKDGNVYFAIARMQAVGKVNLATGKVSYDWLPMTGDTGTNAIVQGHDGRLWLGGCNTIYAVSY